MSGGSGFRLHYPLPQQQGTATASAVAATHKPSGEAKIANTAAAGKNNIWFVFISTLTPERGFRSK